MVFILNHEKQIQPKTILYLLWFGAEGVDLSASVWPEKYKVISFSSLTCCSHVRAPSWTSWQSNVPKQT